MAAVFSGTYNFGSTPSEQLIVDAFERIGILPDLITAQQIQSAQRSSNLMLSEWISKGFNLWTSTQSILALVTNQAAYQLPIPTSDVIDVTIRQSTRNLGGTAFSSAGGVAANAFGGEGNCIQNAPNGYISYNYGANVQYAISMVGVQSNITIEYTLLFEYSNDNVNWFTALAPPFGSYTDGIVSWFAIPTPTSAQYFRVRENGGATLNIQQLYFNTATNDIVMSRISGSEYTSIPNKTQSGLPSSYWLNRQVNPVLTIWPVPTPQYITIFYRRIRMLMDVGQMTDSVEIPQRFYEPFCAGLAMKLSVKYAPEKYPLLKAEYVETFNNASWEDSEKVPLRLIPDYRQGWIEA